MKPPLECLKKGGLWRLAMDPNKWPSQKKEAGGYNFGTTGFGTGWQRQFLVSEAKGAASAWPRLLRCSRCAARASEARCCSWHVPCVSDRATHQTSTACGAEVLRHLGAVQAY